ncbi:hypothetical protein ACFYPZ_24455 [Streptomyces sp. NPDC005506]
MTEEQVVAEYEEAYRALVKHTENCLGCLEGCPEGDDLRRAVREAR